MFEGRSAVLTDPRGSRYDAFQRTSEG